MLDRVPLLEKHLEDYAAVVGEDVIDQVRMGSSWSNETRTSTI